MLMCSGSIFFRTRFGGDTFFQNLLLANKADNCLRSGPDSSVGIATDYGLDGPGSNTGGDEIFSPSRPALVPTQLPGLSRG